MKVVLFYHSFVSCWSNGNAHFLRGVVRQLIRSGHEVHVYEPRDGWSREHALQDPHGAEVLKEAARLVPGVRLHLYDLAHLDLGPVLDGAELVIVHEWSEPALVAAVGRRRLQSGEFVLLFHDSHHRMVSAADEMAALELDGYDAVLAFGESLSEVYRRCGWGGRVFTWHEAADTHIFQPRRAGRSRACDVIWVGNWGDGDRSAELRRYLMEPVSQLRLRTDIYGVRYTDDARAMLAQYGIRYRGWLPNHRTPQAFARAGATVHVPRRPYIDTLPGVPTIRVFEALACGIPLVCAPWHDSEELFPPGSYIAAKSASEMPAAIRMAVHDRDVAKEIVRNGLRAIRHRHTCAHRVEELLKIHRRLASKEAPRDTGAPMHRAEAAH